MSLVLLKPSVLRSWRISRSVGAVLTLTKNCKKYKTRGGRDSSLTITPFTPLVPHATAPEASAQTPSPQPEPIIPHKKAHQTLKTKTTMNPQISSGGHLGRNGLLIGMIMLPT
ncbi:hypothetical protein Hanom_Chr01g00023521 [Helianthus anomalus]